MNKTVSITLSGVIFHIEEDAYNKLKNYLDAIREHFVESSGGDEIMDDIEASIAEKFSEKISKKKQVISKQEVEDLIKVMGSVEDFKEGGEVKGQADETKNESKDNKDEEVKKDDDDDYEVAKKLYRDSEDVVFAGVCSGIAAYFGVDPVLVRLLFVVTIFFGGAGFIAYIVLWIAMPEAKSSTQKLEMRGKRVTIKKIEKVIKERIEPKVKNSKSGIKRVISFPFVVMASAFKALKGFFKIIGPVIRIFVGILIVLVSFCVILPLVFTAAVLIFNIDSPYFNTDIPVNDLLSTIPYTFGIVSGALVIIIPFIFSFLLGVMVLSKKKVFNIFVNTFLLIVWMFSIVSFGVIALDAAPQIERKIKEINEIETISQGFEIESFEEIEIDVPYNVNINQGEAFSVEAIGREKDIKNIKVENVEGKLFITKNREESGMFCLFCYDWPLTINVTAPDIEKIKTGGYSKVFINNFDEELIELISTDTSRVHLESSFEKVISNLDNYSYLYINKPVKEIESVLNDYSRVIATEVVPEKMKFDVEDNSRVIFDVKEVRNGTTTRLTTVDVKLKEYSRFISSGLMFSDVIIDAEQYSRAEMTYFGFDDILSKTNLVINLDDYSRFTGTEMRIERADVVCDDESRVDISGEAETFIGKFRRYSKLRGFDLKTDQAKIEADKYSKVEIDVDSILDAKAYNYASISYKGNPKLKSETESSGKIKRYDGRPIDDDLREIDQEIGEFFTELEEVVEDIIDEEIGEGL